MMVRRARRQWNQRLRRKRTPTGGRRRACFPPLVLPAASSAADGKRGLHPPSESAGHLSFSAKHHRRAGGAAGPGDAAANERTSGQAIGGAIMSHGCSPPGVNNDAAHSSINSMQPCNQPARPSSASHSHHEAHGSEPGPGQSRHTRRKRGAGAISGGADTRPVCAGANGLFTEDPSDTIVDNGSRHAVGPERPQFRV